jgi:carboxypeptidase C (cathepsin A)
MTYANCGSPFPLREIISWGWVGQKRNESVARSAALPLTGSVGILPDDPPAPYESVPMHRPIVVLLLAALVAHADEPARLKEISSQTKHEITIDGKKVEYQATAGTMNLKDEDGKPQASIFFIAYTKPGEDPTKRPITFCFNGGPGSSSVWLHLGAFGPRRVAFTDDGQPLGPPVKMVDNEGSLLDLTDLVFIDPVSTGFSRAADEKNAKAYHGVQEDLNSVGDFIRLYTTKTSRWGSPKYLAGESYGTTRAAGLANHLQSRVGMRLNGIMLVSAVLNFGTIRFDDGNDMPYPLFLPSYAATAWYHKKLDSSLQGDLKKTVDEAEAFATGEYAQALHRGLALSTSEKKAVAGKVARFTGLSEDFVMRCDLRVEGQRFMRELLRDRGRTVGRYDSRYLGKDATDAGERPEYDPSYAAVQGTFTEGFNSYARGELKFESDLPYEILTGKVQPWNYGTANNRYLNVAPALRSAMTENPALRVFVANGYYDLATPFAATQYTVNHLGSDRALLDRVTMAYYEAGHMMYVHHPSLVKLKKDAAAFYTAKP